MQRNKVYNRKKLFIVVVIVAVILIALIARLVYLMVFCSEYYGVKAKDLHQRERSIKAARGEIIDRNGILLATNKTVCTVSVIHSQIKEPEEVIVKLSEILELDPAYVRKRVEKVSSMEIIKKNIDKRVGDEIRKLSLDGVKVDEDFKRYYPYGELASKVIGFTGADNQGIIGLEVKYDEVLSGTDGKILTLTDARGIEIEDAAEERVEAIAGKTLKLSIDLNIQQFIQQEAYRAMEEKGAGYVSILVMNPQNGEILGMANVPEFDLNDPFTLDISDTLPAEEKQEALNQMWRNQCINDTYEPGSTFKIITMAAGLSEGVVTPEDRFNCPGFIIVGDRRIRCHQTRGHGAESFVEGAMNSCNPVFIDVGLRLGIDKYYDYFKQFGLLNKTGIDLPGEAGTIMHKKENMGEVELATVAFGQSFQITPIQLATTVSSIINGGNRVVPHFAVSAEDASGKVEAFTFASSSIGISKEVSNTVKNILEKVVAEGTGKNAKVEGFSIGGKTATSQTLPRSANKYIASFLGFSPAENPQVLVLVIINDPQGIYYGGTVAAPVANRIFENILPYLNISGETADIEDK